MIGYTAMLRTLLCFQVIRHLRADLIPSYLMYDSLEKGPQNSPS